MLTTAPVLSSADTVAHAKRLNPTDRSDASHGKLIEGKSAKRGLYPLVSIEMYLRNEQPRS